MRPDGSCPRCGVIIDASTRPQATARDLKLRDLASSTTSRGDDDDKAPWHFKLLVVALIGYIAWRIIDVVL